MKRLFILILSLFALTLAGQPAFGAETTCQPIYGGGQTCIQTGKVLLNKTVKNPNDNNFVENLNINNAKYSPSQEILFKIWVKNESDKTVSVTIKDMLPQYITYISSPGAYDANTKTLTFEVKDLKVNEEKSYEVKGKIAQGKDLPSPNGAVCVVNQAVLTTSNGDSAQDNAQFCIETKITTKGGLPVAPAPEVLAATPATGPEMLSLLALIPSGLAGLMLRKRSKINN